MRPEEPQNSDSGELPMRLGQVASFIARGYSDKQIAAELNLSPRTIHRHVVRLLERLGVENRAAAAAIWARRTMGAEQQNAANGTAHLRRTSAPSHDALGGRRDVT